MKNMLNLLELRSVVKEAKESGRLICLAPDTIESLLNLAEMKDSGTETKDKE
jgi:hypothetical protein